MAFFISHAISTLPISLSSLCVS